MEEPKKLLVSESRLKYLQDTLAEERTCDASEYLKGHARGIAYALIMLGLPDEEAEN